MIDRIMQVIDFYGINKNIFYKTTGLSNGYLDKVRSVGSSNVEKILKAYPKISREWLMTGEGSMLVSSSKKTIETYVFSVESKMAESEPKGVEEFVNRSEEDDLLIKFLIGRNKELEAENKMLKEKTAD